MNRQQIFNSAAAHLMRQGGPSWQPNGCYYRLSDICLSPLGHLMGPQIYADHLENHDPADLPWPVFDAIGAETEDDVAFLVAIESAHDQAARAAEGDQAAFWRSWTAAMRALAERHGLFTDSLEQSD